MKKYFTLASVFFWIAFVSMFVGGIAGLFYRNVFWYGLSASVMSCAVSCAFYVVACHKEGKQ